MKKLKRWILGLLALGTVTTVPLAAIITPENTTYRLYWDEAFDQISCARDYADLAQRAACNEQAYLESAKTYVYPNAVGGKDLITGTYRFTEYVEIFAPTQKAANDYFKQDRKGILPGANVKAKTLLGNYVEVEPITKLYKEKEGTWKEPLTVLDKLLQSIAGFLNVAYATFPSENFESYGTGDLNGGAGGTGWSANWACGTDFDVVSTPTKTGSRAGGATASLSDHTCRRLMTANSTDNEIFSIYQLRTINSGGDNWQSVLDDSAGPTAHTIWSMATNGQIRIYDNLTLTNVQAYNVSTWYQIELKINYTNKTNSVAIDGGSFTSYTFYNNGALTDTGRYRLDYNPHASDGNSIGFDDINTAAVAAPADLMEDGWFMVL